MASVTMRTLVLLGTLVVGVYCSHANYSANESYYFSGEKELCDFLIKTANENQQMKFLNITLNSSQLHILDSELIITLVATSSQQLYVSIQSDNQTIPANISCRDATGGIAFVHYYAVHLTNLVFHHCGAFFSNDSLRDTDGSDVYFDSNASAVLLFNHCSHLKLSGVSIVNYRGFAVASINNLHSSSFDNFLVSQTISTTRSGSGILLLFKNSYLLTPEYSPNTTLTGCRFLNNTSELDIHGCQTNVYNSDQKKIHLLPVYYAAGLTIIYNQRNVTAHVHVLNSTFNGNIGKSYAGAMLVKHLNSPVRSVTTIGAGTVFVENKIRFHCHGSAIIFFTYFSLDNVTQPVAGVAPVVLLNVTQTSLSRQDGKGAVFVSVSNQVLFRVIVQFKMVNFTNNTAKYGLGVCMYTITLTSNQFGKLDTTYGLEIHLDSVRVSRNMQNLSITGGIPTTSIFTFKYVNLLIISGTKLHPSVFTKNFGSVFEMVVTTVSLQGTLVFADNHAYDGAAIMMKRGHSINLAQNLSAVFTNNLAQHQGGAIYADTRQRSCVFQIEDFSSTALVYQNATLMFTNNSARLSGNAIFAAPIYHCYMSDPDTLVLNETKLSQIYDRLFHFQPSGSNANHNLSTIPYKLVSHKMNCRNKPIYTYPGKTLRIKLAALSEVNQTCFSQVHITLSKWNGPKVPVTDIDLWSLSHGQEVQVVKEDQTWTTLNITIRTTNDSCVSRKGNKTPCQGLFTVSLPNKPGAFSCRVVLNSCPPWFKLKVYSGRCECSDLLKKFDEDSFCNIQKKLIETRSLTNFWLGKVKTTGQGKKNKTMAIALNCPLSMCNTSIFSKNRHLKVSFKTGEIIGLCWNNRTGELCGRCKPGQSIVAGSDQCMICSNWYLFTIIYYLCSGVVLIVILYCLRFTLASGTMNGLIFFANTSFNELLIFFLIKSGSPTLDRYSLLSSWLVKLPNLSLGYGLCLYDGMTEAIKVSINLIYPVYLLMIVGLLALVSRYSLKVSRYLKSSTIQVLVTVVHLSFVSILLTVTDVFTPAYIYTEDGDLNVVWARNGSIAYFQQQHRSLVLVSTTILLGFMLPYLTLLIIARPLKCLSCVYHQTQAVLDVFHAPYKQEYKRWFVYRLLLQIMLIILYTSLHQSHIHIFGITSGLTMLFFLVSQAYLKPFKSWFINTLDLWLMMNYTIVTVIVVLFFYKGQKVFMAILVCNVTVTLVFVTYLAVLTYHFLLVTGGLKKMKRCFAKLKISYERCLLSMRGINRSGTSLTSYHPIPQHSSLAGVDQESFSPCAQLREPVLSFEDSD